MMQERVKQRLALNAYFFFSGLTFATWASRIPSIKTYFNFNEAELGTILLAMPISSIIGLPVSGWLISKYNSRGPLVVAFVCFALALMAIGFVTTPFLLVVSICVFSFFMRIINISMNTQSITLQKKYEKRIVGSFHGLWSTGGLVGVGFSTLMVKLDVGMSVHLMIVSIITLVCSIVAYFFTLTNDKAPTGNKLILGKPDAFILYLGLLVFFAALCEGGMFDWSGVYFKEVVEAEVFTYGYLTFMTFMAMSRFFSDRLVELLGMPKTFAISAVSVAIGILISIIWPYFWPALFGFCLVGFGTASVFPMAFSLAGTSQKYSAGMAISIISTYGTLGMLIGPPMVGYLAHAFGLRYAFFVFVFSGLMLIPISRLFFNRK